MTKENVLGVANNLKELIERNAAAPIEQKREVVERIIARFTEIMNSDEKLNKLGYVSTICTTIDGEDIAIDHACTGPEPQVVHAFYLEQLAKLLGKEALRDPMNLIQAIMGMGQIIKEKEDKEHTNV